MPDVRALVGRQACWPARTGVFPDGDDLPVTIRFSGTLSGMSAQVVGSLRVAMPAQTWFVVDLSRVVEILPGALDVLVGALRSAVVAAGWRVSFSSALPGAGSPLAERMGIPTGRPSV
jgi:hypothetical protein